VVWRAKLAASVGASHLLLDAKLQDRCDSASWKQAADIAREIGVELVGLPNFRFDSSARSFVPAHPHGADEETAGIDPAELADWLRKGRAIPEWFTYPEVLEELGRSHPARNRRGVTVFFTGLSGAGKSTIARVLLAKLLEVGGRTVTLLDGDIVRKNLSSELGFSREHRDLNILRIGFVASEITKHGGIAICAPIAPYRATRRAVRRAIEVDGEFIEVYVATPLETCEARDRKGLYLKARRGVLKEFTGISDPYEVPEKAEIIIDTRDCTPLEAAQRIITYLENRGYIR
jgi:sulfate adenylyltransferase